MIEKANQFIKANQERVNPRYRQTYHLMPPIGWMNDPNGFSLYNNRYHLFYQYYPYKESWNSMHWGHTTTTDFVTWQNEDVALAPDQPYDAAGCFSGSAIEYNGKLYIMYTSVHKDGEQNIQEQALAVSEDGIHFTKSERNPVIPSSALPKSICPGDFRDPKLFRLNDRFYSAVVARDEMLGGRMLLFESFDLEHWSYKCDYIQPKQGFGTMWECPDIFEIDDRYAVLMSVIYLPREGYHYWNKQSTVYALGRLDDKGESLTDYQFHEIDCGFDFYAPQTVQASDGRRIMTAWMQAWEDSIPTEDLQHGWAGSMILPRELTVENGLLVQQPVREIENYRVDKVSYEQVDIVEEEVHLHKINGSSIEIELEADLTSADSFTVNLFETKDNKIVITYDKKQEELTFDRSHSGIKISPKNFRKPDFRTLPVKLDQNKLQLRIFVDTCSVEVFVQKGSIVITSRVYPLGDEYEVGFSAKGKAIINKISKWELNCNL
ncbi:MAG TPA: glycoside hydrolase family 32 protein [Mobilitalea sp.]|nr:glycoside hydrolase family 32 protein [Mobilitalea sp.]